MPMISGVMHVVKGVPSPINRLLDCVFDYIRQHDNCVDNYVDVVLTLIVNYSSNWKLNIAKYKVGFVAIPILSRKKYSFNESVLRTRQYHVLIIKNIPNPIFYLYPYTHVFFPEGSCLQTKHKGHNNWTATF